MTLAELKIELEKQGIVVRGPYGSVDIQVSVIGGFVKIFYSGHLPVAVSSLEGPRILVAPRFQVPFLPKPLEELTDSVVGKILEELKELAVAFQKDSVTSNVVLFSVPGAWGYGLFLNEGEPWKSTE
jgi:hypothetical protein